MTRRRVALWVLLVGLPLAKLAQLEWFEGKDWLRQVALVVACAAVVAMFAKDGTRLRSMFNWQFFSPAPKGDAWWRVLAWTIGPAVIVVLGVLGLNHVFWGHGVALDCGEGCKLFDNSDSARALCVFLVVGFGEEYLYRGLLLVLAIRAKLDGGNFVFLSLSFALWHVPDEIVKGSALVAGGGAVLATFLASHLVLFPVRLRSRSVIGPALLHASTNLSLLLVR